MAAVLREFGHGLIELAPRSLLGSPDDKMQELELFERLARISGKTVTFAPLHDTRSSPGSAQQILAAATARSGAAARASCRRSAAVRSSCASTSRSASFGLENNGFWKPIMHQPRAERRALFASAAFREQLRGYESNFKALLTPSWERMFLRVPGRPENARCTDVSVATIAAETRQAPGRRVPRRRARRRPRGPVGRRGPERRRGAASAS